MLYAYSTKQKKRKVHSCFVFSALPQATIEGLRKKCINIFFKKLMVRRSNTFKNSQKCTYFLKMYWTTFTNTYPNVLKIVTNKMGQIIHKRIVTGVQ